MRVPTKATYELFDDDPTEEFDHYLCERLGWGSVERMRRTMSMAEWQRWKIYLAREAQRRELARLQAGG